jgi:hypothetical protein
VGVRAPRNCLCIVGRLTEWSWPQTCREREKVGFQTVRMNGTVREGRIWDECDSMIRFCNSDLLRNKSSLLKVYVNDW